MTIDWAPLRQIIDENQRFILSSHVRPDADALGSELALMEVLQHLGKTVRIANPSALPHTLEFLDPAGRALKLGVGITADEVLDCDVHIVLDTSAWAQLVDVGKLMKKSNATKVVIDHHVSADNLGALEFKDTSAEATGTLVYRFLRTLDVPISQTAATNLYCAIATDTGWFRFPSTTSETMRVIAELIDLGAEPHSIYQRLYEQRSLARVKLIGRALMRVQLDCDGRLAFTSVTSEDFSSTGATPVDTEDLVNECLKLEGVVAAFIAIEQPSGRVKFSLRSRSGFNVAEVAEHFGGGGHKQAAGTVLPAPMATAQQKILHAMRAALES